MNIDDDDDNNNNLKKKDVNGSYTTYALNYRYKYIKSTIYYDIILFYL